MVYLAVAQTAAAMQVEDRGTAAKVVVAMVAAQEATQMAEAHMVVMRVAAAAVETQEAGTQAQLLHSS